MNKPKMSAVAFIEMTVDEQTEYLKKMSRARLTKLVLQCATEAAVERAEKDRLAAASFRHSETVEGLEDERERFLETSRLLEDEVNQLRNIEQRYQQIIEAALKARDLHVIANDAVQEAVSADLQLAAFGLEFTVRRENPAR